MGLSGKCCSDDESYEESADEDGWGEPTGGMRALLQEITIAAKKRKGVPRRTGSGGQHYPERSLSSESS
eukprot:COSAG01_NODE_2203_length_8173_cov_8.387293_9_plen_69_part_00